jgi:hypothetical protein
MRTNRRFATLARIFTNGSDRYQGEPLYERLLYAARELGLAGATVLRGVQGFGASGIVHSEPATRPGLDLPMVVIVVDSGERLERFLDLAQAMLDASGSGGLIAVEAAEVKLRSRKSSTRAARRRDVVALVSAGDCASFVD